MRGVDGALRAWSFAHILYAQRVAELTYACTERTKVVDSVASLHVASAGAHVPLFRDRTTPKNVGGRAFAARPRQ